VGGVAVEVEGFGKVYEAGRGELRQAVSDLSFHLEGAQILGLLGPNGAGKTTTLRTLAGILEPSEGTLRVAGRDVVREPLEAKARLGFVPDDPQLFAALTVWEHLVLSASLHRLADWKERAHGLLEAFELAERTETLAAELSRGMRQKLAVAGALLHRPEVLLLDEPLAGLDPRGIRTVTEVIVRHAEGGAAVIVSSHLLSQIEPWCTRFLILREGKRLFLGAKGEIASRLPTLRADASLEELFFEATEGASHS